MNREKIFDVIGGILSLLFLGAVFYLYFFQVFHEQYIFNVNDEIITYGLEEHHSCHINIAEPTIILRMDDVRAYSIQTPYLIDAVLKRGMSITLGVIPYNIGQDIKMQRYLIKIRENPNIEIAQHGTHHTSSEVNVEEEELVEGIMDLQKYLGVKPITYIPPYNKITPESVEVLSKYFNVISADEGILKEGENIAQIGLTSNTYDYIQKEEIPTDEVIEECKASLEKTNLCVIVIHPQEYSTDINKPTEINQEKMQEFRKMLDKLEGLNANFATFKDVVFCEP